MKTWTVAAGIVGSKYLGKVKAETAEEALKKGWDLDEGHVSLCHQCADECEDPQVSSIHVYCGEESASDSGFGEAVTLRALLKELLEEAEQHFADAQGDREYVFGAPPMPEPEIFAKVREALK